MEAKCPDFELAPKVDLDPNFFISNDDTKDRLGAFIITLGLVNNDFKGLQWWASQLLKGKPENREANEYNGQWAGMNIQISRYLLALLVELLNTILKHKELLKTKEYYLIFKKLSPPSKKCWGDLVAVANYRESKNLKYKKLFSLLQEVRNNASYHYENSGEILKGYKSYFGGEFKEVNKESYEKVCYSLGRTMESTRFYFSDAAIDGYQRLKAKQFNEAYGEYRIDEMVKDALFNLNNSIPFIIEAFIRLRKAGQV